MADEPKRRDPFLRTRLDAIEHALCNPAARPTTVRCLGIVLLRYCSREEFARSGNIEAWPSIARIAAEAGMTEDTASAAVRQACDLGYLERIRKGSRGRGHTSVYRLIPHAAPPSAKHPTNGVMGERFLGAKTPSDQVIYELDLGSENPRSAVFENPETDPCKTPSQQGSNPCEPGELNPSRADERAGQQPRASEDSSAAPSSKTREPA